MLIDAVGNEIRSDRCACGRHKYAAKLWCCGACDGTGDTPHSSSCNMVQEHFADTRRGVVVSEAHGLRVVETMKPQRTA